MKKSQISLFTVIMLVLLLVLVGYYFLFFVPGQTELTMLRAETTTFNAEASIYEPYLSDAASLESDIADIQAQIDELHVNGYINDSTVSLIISEAIQRFSVSLNSITLSDETMVGEHRALPINLALSGSMDNILSFLSYFENDLEGSYLVQAAALEINAGHCTASVVIYLCTPAV